MIPDTTPTAERYRNFARWVARAESERYAQLTVGVASDPEALRFLDELPAPKRHPQLLLAAVRYLGADPATYEELRTWVLKHSSQVAGVMLRRQPQVNDFGRCASILPLLAALPQPLALLEVGASAGLCLYPDRYQYEYGGHRVGPASSGVRLVCPAVGDPPLPAEVPHVVWRAGIDLEPLDVQDDDDARWLEALFWPGQAQRTDQLREAVAIARREPPLMVRGDLNAQLAEVAGQAPAGATLVVLHSAVLSYLDPEARSRFARQVREINGHWIFQELPGSVPEVARSVPRPPRAAHQAIYVVAVDRVPVAFAAMHGEWLDWFADAAKAQ
jgi:hypothetical protein